MYGINLLELCVCGLFGCWTPGHDQMQHRYWVNDLFLNAHLLAIHTTPSIARLQQWNSLSPGAARNCGASKGVFYRDLLPPRKWQRLSRKVVQEARNHNDYINRMFNVFQACIRLLGMTCWTFAFLLLAGEYIYIYICEYVWFPLVEGQMIRISSFLPTYMYVNNYLIIYKLILKMDEDCGR